MFFFSFLLYFSFWVFFGFYFGLNVSFIIPLPHSRIFFSNCKSIFLFPILKRSFFCFLSVMVALTLYMINVIYQGHWLSQLTLDVSNVFIHNLRDQFFFFFTPNYFPFKLSNLGRMFEVVLNILLSYFFFDLYLGKMFWFGLVRCLRAYQLSWVT